MKKLKINNEQMKKIPIFVFLVIVIVTSLAETVFLSGLYGLDSEEISFWIFLIIFIFPIFTLFMYVETFFIFFHNQQLIPKYLLILIALNSSIQLINIFRVHDSGFYLLGLGNIYFTIFVLLFLHLKFYVDETTFDMRVSIFQQMKLKDILFDYGYLILLGLPLQYPNVYSIIGTCIVLALLLAIDFKYTKHKNEKRKLEMNEEIS